MITGLPLWSMAMQNDSLAQVTLSSSVPLSTSVPGPQLVLWKV
jgi:hypothetical protein